MIRPASVSRLAIAIALATALAACGDKKEEAKAPAAPTAAEAMAFVTEAEARLETDREYAARAAWVQANFVTVDTSFLAARADEASTALSMELAKDAARFNDVEVDAETRRKLEIMKQGLTIPAPSDPALASELATIKADLDSMYATGKYCKEDGTCLNDRDIIRIMASSRDPEELKDVWAGWRQVSAPMKDKYARMVELANAGSRDLGFADTGALWRSGYDMPADDFTAETERLWGQVKPLYQSLQCHVRAKLSDYYGSRTMPQDGTIPAHLVGNVWAQQWGEIFDLVASGDADPGYDLTALLNEKGYDAMKIAKTGEQFFTSLGIPALPETFWERSLITKPRDRDVQCHASAWDITTSDVRIKMCTEVTGEDFRTMHHELGHIFYYTNYAPQSILFRGGAHDGFHEAIGDAVALSTTPAYLVELGLLDEQPDAAADIGLLLKQALDKVAFLPFGLMVDRWRWGVFNGEITPDHYNEAWWKLRRQYQGLSAPVERTEADFDPGAKYHIPGNTPYTRYFLAHILQFQLYKAACEQAGFDGPLHRCSFYGNKEVGEKLKAMLAMGASKPWPEALEAFAGTRDMDASAVLAYFAPLQAWLDEQNKDRNCGWE
ncbi:M2 family metallopeptidase [Gimibacter soli]|uniref:M2 family metallopeptidase n=1 Tax=Gimibacter soli TaxID=3024400 RepID=A0AAF0BHJ6_9PROT|nr:M2 family metallopeptidase [Gimibacter soli]WCL54328.1 M2 family metallopeptidase [Gimibacter soli]